MKSLLLSAALAASVVATTASAVAIDAKKATELMAKAGCSACHQVDKKIVGPALKEVAKKYKGNAKAPDMLFAKVRAGGAKVWGPVPMPPNPKENISDDDLKSLLGWILGL